MAVRRKHIEQLAAQVLKDAGVTGPAVPVERIARLKGLDVRKQRIPDSDISGFLFQKGAKALIGVNARHSQVRQRFTIAHELGHVLLQGAIPNEFHVDRGFQIRFRDFRSSEGVDIEERESNLFAAELLMPKRFLAKDIADTDQLDLVDDDTIAKLANRYGVSNQALVFRLVNLGYIKL